MVRTCKDCHETLELNKDNFQRRVRINRHGEERDVYDYACKPCTKRKIAETRGVPWIGKRKPLKLTGWKDPIDRLFFCQVKP